MFIFETKPDRHSILQFTHNFLSEGKLH